MEFWPFNRNSFQPSMPSRKLQCSMSSRNFILWMRAVNISVERKHTSFLASRTDSALLNPPQYNINSFIEFGFEWISGFHVCNWTKNFYLPNVMLIEKLCVRWNWLFVKLSDCKQVRKKCVAINGWVHHAKHATKCKPNKTA